MEDVSIGLEHVDLLNLCDWLDVELLELGLQLLVITTAALVCLLYNSSGRSLSTVREFVSNSNSVIVAH